MLRRLAPLAVAVLAVVVAACGSSGSGADADPAAVAPPGAPFYVEVTLRPEGGVRDDALAAAGKVLRTDDPEAKIGEVVQDVLDDTSSKVDFAKDIEPWLGNRGGLWVTMPAKADGEPEVGAAIAVKDADLAREKIVELAKRGGEKLTHHEVDGNGYDVDEDDTAVAVEDDYAIVGSEAAVRKALGTTLDGDSLADDERYKNAIDPLTDDHLAHYYLDTKAFFDAALRDPETSRALGPLRSMFSGQLGQPQAASFSADGDRLLLESFTKGGDLLTRLGGLSGLPASDLLAQLPADSLGAAAVPKLGESLRTYFNEFAGAFGGAAASEQLKSELGIDLEQDVFAWMGDAGLFVRGGLDTPFNGALVIESTDETKSTNAFGKLVGIARARGGLDPQPTRVDGADAAFAVETPETPGPVIFARGNGRVVVAVGQQAAADGLSASQTLEGSDVLVRADNALGGEVDTTLFVAMTQVLALLEAAAAGDPDFAKARPYLEALDVVAAGSKQDGDTLRSRFGVGLK